MLKKNYTKTGKTCRVTFRIPSEVSAEKAAICGDFNGWDTSVNPMKKLADGGFSVTISLGAGSTYRFRYLLDNERWENDWEADAYEPNEFGSDDSVVSV